ncbi:MAG: hypothetical protein H6R11_2489 [Proteobacteria bacterium]|nr:hypothetical protein [Pseudomonadota bacterium]
MRAVKPTSSLISSATPIEIRIAIPNIHSTLTIAALTMSIRPIRRRYKGMLPCFLAGRSSRLDKVLRSARASIQRVSRGSMTSVM